MFSNRAEDNKRKKMNDEAIWVNVVPNDKKTEDKHPDWVAPKNPKSPEGKNWTIGVKVGGAWYSQAGWNTKDDSGQPTGGITIKLTPNSTSATSSGGGGQPTFTPQKTFAKNVAYGTNKPSGF